MLEPPSNPEAPNSRQFSFHLSASIHFICTINLVPIIGSMRHFLIIILSSHYSIPSIFLFNLGPVYVLSILIIIIFSTIGPYPNGHSTDANYRLYINLYSQLAIHPIIHFTKQHYWITNEGLIMKAYFAILLVVRVMNLPSNSRLICKLVIRSNAHVKCIVNLLLLCML